MANEPNKAEEELKRYAAERRAQAPKELHGATRRMLQGEVARVYGGRRGEEIWWKRLLIAPKFAWGISFVAICGISILALRQPSHPREEFAGAKEAETVLELTQRREDAETLRDEKKKEADFGAVPADSVAQAAPPPAIVPTAPAPVSVLRAQNIPAPEPAGEVRLRKAEPARVEKAAASGAAMGVMQPIQKNEFYLQNNISPAQVKDKQDAVKLSQVLTRFTLQEAGRKVVVVDADGSPYSGSNLSQQAGTNLFLVSGTNRTLNQRVDFRGQYFRVPAQQQVLKLQPAQNQNALNQNVQNQIAREQVRVQGEAVVDNRSQVKVDAQAPSQ